MLTTICCFCYCCCSYFSFFFISSTVVNAKLCEYMKKSKLSLWVWEMDKTKQNERRKRACIMSWCVSYIRIEEPKRDITMETHFKQHRICFKTAKMDTMKSIEMAVDSKTILTGTYLCLFEWRFALTTQHKTLAVSFISELASATLFSKNETNLISDLYFSLYAYSGATTLLWKS